MYIHKSNTLFFTLGSQSNNRYLAFLHIIYIHHGYYLARTQHLANNIHRILAQKPSQQFTYISTLYEL